MSNSSAHDRDDPEHAGVEELLDEEQVAEILGVSRSSVRKWRCAGAGPPWIKIEGCVRYSPSGLADHLRRNTRQSTSETANAS